MAGVGWNINHTTSSSAGPSWAGGSTTGAVTFGGSGTGGATVTPTSTVGALLAQYWPVLLGVAVVLYVRRRHR
jgi:hypothetical protein